MNSGQICMSTERVIVANSIADTFTAKLKARMEKIKTGNHLKDPSVDLSGLIHQASADRCIKLLKEAVEAGATPVLGDFKANGTIVQPHILDNVTNTMRAFVEESFGPSKQSCTSTFMLLSRLILQWSPLPESTVMKRLFE